MPTKPKFDRDEREPTHQENNVGLGNGRPDYTNFGEDYEGMVCTACGQVIEHGDLAFVINFGMESRKHPLTKVLRFTGIAYHAGGYKWSGSNKGPRKKCLDVKQLPGCADRDGIEEEFSRAIFPTPTSRMDH